MLNKVEKLEQENVTLQLHLDSLCNTVTSCNNETEFLGETLIRQEEQIFASKNIQDGLRKELESLHEHNRFLMQQ